MTLFKCCLLLSGTAVSRVSLFIIYFTLYSITSGCLINSAIIKSCTAKQCLFLGNLRHIITLVYGVKFPWKNF